MWYIVYDDHATLLVLTSTPNTIIAMASHKHMVYTFTNYIFEHSWLHAGVAVPHLISNLDEAQGRLIWYVIETANSDSKSIAQCSPNTDVLILLLHDRPTISA